MILQQLPDPHHLSDGKAIPTFPDHVLFTERISRKYEYPEHTATLGLISSAEGSGDFYVNQKRHQITPDNFLVVDTASALAIKISDVQSQPSLLFFHAGLPELVATSLYQTDEQLLEDHRQRVTDFSYLERVHAIDSEMRSILSFLPGIGFSCASFHALKADLLVRHLLERLCATNNQAIKSARKLTAIKSSTRLELYKRLAIIKEWINDHYADAVTLEVLGKMASMNSQHLLRMFRQAFGITPYQYLSEVRMNNARHLLTTTEMTVSAISEAVGFDSLTYFSWLFKQKTGLSPKAFRQAR